jgi:hypothetical protein
MIVDRNINYIDRDFPEFRSKLIDFTQTYFPTTYNDFSPASPGMLFIEMASYVGDVLSFYLDNQIQENFLQYARQLNNVYQLAYMFGYKPRLTATATVDLDIYQQVPAINVGGSYVPDFSYALLIQPNSTATSQTPAPINFIIEEPVDFSTSSSLDATEVTVYQVDGSNNPITFLLRKQRKATAGSVNTTTFSFGSPEQFATVTFNTSNFIGILDVTDSDGKTWSEVDYLAQDVVYDSIKNTNINDPRYSQYADAPYLLKLKGVQRRFTTRVLDPTTIQLQFGAGTTGDNDEIIVPNPDNVGLGLPYGQSKLTAAYDPTNFIFTNTYGIAPSNTTLTVRYLTGGGVSSNVPANTITTITGQVSFVKQPTNTATADSIFATLATNNLQAASGGGDGDTVTQIRQNTIGSYNSQLRTVTQDDYTIRALSMPSKYGTIAKAFVEQTKQSTVTQGEIPAVLDLYVLGYNQNRSLATLSEAVKTNLSTYLSQYRVVGDSVRIKDGFIINIGVDFSIITLPNFISSEVLTQCISTLQLVFDIRNWQINQPILLRDIYNVLLGVRGVQTVTDVSITNKVGGSYSQYAYDIKGATVQNIVYPSLDPSIFEVKFPNTDITGRVVSI